MHRRWFLAFGLLVIAVAAPGALILAAESEEAAVKAVLGSYVDADRKHDVDGILALFAPDARVDSIVAGAKVSKEMYAAAMKGAQARGMLGRDMEAKVTSVTFPNPDRAILEFDYDLDTARGAHRSYKLKWTLTKRDGRWLILETEYVKK